MSWQNIMLDIFCGYNIFFIIACSIFVDFCANIPQNRVWSDILNKPCNNYTEIGKNCGKITENNTIHKSNHYNSPFSCEYCMVYLKLPKIRPCLWVYHLTCIWHVYSHVYTARARVLPVLWCTKFRCASAVPKMFRRKFSLICIFIKNSAFLNIYCIWCTIYYNLLSQ